jgi:hypothetical protein
MPDDGGKQAGAKALYAKSASSSCHQCKEKISKGGVRIEYQSSFYHPKCLSELNLFKKPAEE